MVFTCRVHSNTRNQICRGCLQMERSHDQVQVLLRREVERRERTKKIKLYVACLIMVPILTTIFAYVYFKLHSIKVSVVWVLIFLAAMLTLPFIVAIAAFFLRELKLKILSVRKRIHFQHRNRKINQDYDTFCKIVQDRVLGDDVTRHILSFLPRVISGRRKTKTLSDRVFFKPRHIAIDRDADLAIVTESGKSRLRLMRADLSEPYLDKYLRVREVRNIPFVPEGVAISSHSYGSPWFTRNVRIYVTDVASHRVAMFDVDVESTTVSDVWCVGRLGGMPGRFNRPRGCSISNGRLYVCDTGNHRLQVLSASSGRFLRCIGSEGHGEGRLLEPVDCEVHNNRVYVVDALNFRIQVFCALKGSVLCTWGSRSLSVAGFWRPRCILIHRGYVYITEYDDNHSLCKVFEEHTQRYVNTWFLSSCVQDPIGIAAHGDYIYIVDHRGTVRMFH